MTYKELEPYYDRFERTAGVSGKAGNLRGAKQEGGNVFEAPRDRDYPLPPLELSYSQMLFGDAATQSGYHPFPRPCANASHAYTNPDGSKLAPVCIAATAALVRATRGARISPSSEGDGAAARLRTDLGDEGTS